EVERDDDKDDEEESGDDDQEYDDEYAEETRDEERFDHIPQTPENSDDEGNDEENLGLNVGGEEGHVKEDEEDELHRDVNINQGRGIQENLEVEDSHVTLTPVNPDGQQHNSLVSSQFVTSMLNPTLDEVPSNIIQNLQNFGSLFRFDDRLRSLEANFSEAMQTNQFAGAVSAILRIVHQYMDQRMNEAVKVAVQIQSDRLHDEAQRDNDEFLETVDENMQKINKEQVKEQLKTSYAIAADLSKMELKKILIEKVEGNKSIQRSDEQRNLYKALVEEPSAGPDRGSKRRREGKEPESASAPTETATRSAGSLVELEYQLEEVFKATTDQLDWVNPEGQHYPHNLLKPLPLIPNNLGCRVIPFEHFINKDLEYLRGGASSRYDNHAFWEVSHWGRKRQQFYGFAVNQESARDVYSKRRIIVVTELKIVEWHSYKHLDWITVQRDDDKIYKFKEVDFKRLRIQDIEDMLLLLVQGKLTNLTVEERFAFNRKEAYTAYSNPRGFIYQNKDKRNRLMRIDELHKFSDGTLTDVRTALDDRLKGIQMQYLPQSIWRKSDKDRATTMIQAIDKRQKTRRIMRSLERFIRGRLAQKLFFLDKSLWDILGIVLGLIWNSSEWIRQTGEAVIYLAPNSLQYTNGGERAHVVGGNNGREDGPSWGIPLMTVGEFLEMDPYEEVAHPGLAHPLSPAYVPNPMKLDKHVPVYVPNPEHLKYHAPSYDDIQVEDDDEDPKEDPSEEHEPEGDDEDLKEDPNEEHEPKDKYTRKPFKGSNETKPFEEDETVVTPPPPRHRGARMCI
nr:hypothetical protein [Tanacetum cinerariifolium]